MKRLPMEKYREILRLSAEGLSTRKIAGSLGIGRTTLREYLARACAAGLSWLLPDGLSDSELEQFLFPRPPRNMVKEASRPDWAYVHRELCRKGVTLALLWEEYREGNPDGYCYSHFCQIYARWNGKLSPVMRQHHPAGERLFVDYAGMTVDVTDPETGEVRAAQVFIATMGASSYSYVEAT